MVFLFHEVTSQITNTWRGCVMTKHWTESESESVYYWRSVSRSVLGSCPNLGLMVIFLLLKESCGVMCQWALFLTGGLFCHIESHSPCLCFFHIYIYMFLMIVYLRSLYFRNIISGIVLRILPKIIICYGSLDSWTVIRLTVTISEHFKISVFGFVLPIFRTFRLSWFCMTSACFLHTSVIYS